MAFRSDENGFVKNISVSFGLSRQSSQGIGVALDLVAGHFPVDKCHVNPPATRANAYFVSDNGVGFSTVVLHKFGFKR